MYNHIVSVVEECFLHYSNLQLFPSKYKYKSTCGKIQVNLPSHFLTTQIQACGFLGRIL